MHFEDLKTALETLEMSEEQLDTIASNLIWRIGRVKEDGPVIVRVAYATSAQVFADLPKLRSANDAELELAIKEGNVKVEWVGAKP